MRPRQRQVEKALRVENRQFRVHEHVLHDLEPGLGGPGAVRMPAHAVEHEHQRGFVGNDDRGPVLVVGPVAQCGYLGVLDLHCG